MNATVLITGASSGIGAACGEAFAAAGARVILSARREQAIRDLAEQIEKQHHTEVLPLVMDVRDAAAVDAAIADLPKQWKTIGVLVNNAGLAKGLSPFYGNSVDEIDTMVDTNVKGLLYVSRAVVPGMLERQHGHIINIGSISGHRVYAGATIYCATKFAVRGITEGMKLDLHGTPIRVTAVDPGLVETDFSRVRFDGDTERASAVYAKTVPLTAADVADAVVWCATRPAHVDVADMILMPTDQSSVSHIRRSK